MSSATRMSTSSEQVTAVGPRDVLPGAIDTSPDRARIRRRRAGLHGWQRSVYDYIVVPAEVPAQFNQPLADLIEQVTSKDAQTASTILGEAEAAFREASETIESAERRATTLLGTVAIAASLVVAGAGLLLDPAKVNSSSWRLVLAVSLAAFLVCLVGCGWRALAVTGRIFNFEQPGFERIHLRAKMKGTDAQAFRAAELLRATGVAEEIGKVKVGLLASAAWWLRMALGALAVLVIALVVYVSSADDHRVSHRHANPEPRLVFVHKAI
jgi:hypothetical protein